MTAEVPFHVSSFSGGSACVAVSIARRQPVVVRHSRIAGPHLEFTAAEWAAFVDGVKAGEFDLPG